MYCGGKSDIMFVSGREVSKSTHFETEATENFITCAQTEDKASVWQIRKGREGTTRNFRKLLTNAQTGAHTPKGFGAK